MKKLIAAYLADPSHKNARRLRNYAEKHPMALCVLDHLEAGVLSLATVQIADGR